MKYIISEFQYKFLLEQTSDEVKSQLEWLRSYVMSPMYMERLKKEFPGKDVKFIENERNMRYKNLDNVEYRTKFVKSIGDKPGYVSGLYIPKEREGMFYDYSTGKWKPNKPVKSPKGYDVPGNVYFEKEYSPKTWSPAKGYETIPGHEYSHAVDDAGARIPTATKEKIFRYTNQNDAKNYKSGNLEFDYYTTPTEFIARMQSLRYLMDKLKLYDPKTNKFTESDYMKMINNNTIKQDVHFQDIFDSLKGNENEKKKNFIDLMNTIAYQQPSPSSSQV